jgi:hypothetical protein
MLSAPIFASAVALASTLPLVFAGAVLPQFHDKESSLTRRETTWEAYDQTNVIYAQQGLCRYYIDPTSRDGLWPCRQYCKSDSVTCSGNANSDPSTIFKNPNGERYTPGECWCENPVLETIVEFTAEGLQELPGITCAVWLEALKQSVYLSTWVIPGAGPAAKAAKTIIKTVKRADKLGGKEGWTNFIKDTCHIDQWDFDISAAFNIFEQGDEAQAKRF